MRYLRQAVFLALVSCPLFGGAQDSRSVAVSGAEFAMPLPAGYVDFCGIDEDANSSFPMFVPPQNAFLSCYTTPKDLEEWQEGTGGAFSSYLIATVMKGTMRTNASVAEFAAFSQNLKKSLGLLAAKLPPSLGEQIDLATASLSARYNVDVRTTLEALTPIGVFDEGADRISTVWLASSTHEVDGQSIRDLQVQVSSTALVDGKVFVLFTYGNFQGPPDVERYKNVAQEWTSKFLQANR